MVTTLPELDRSAPQRPPTPAPGPAGLQDQMPSWFRMPRGVVGLAAVLAVYYLFFSYLPLGHTDLWGHLAYGRYMVERGIFPLPQTEPLMPMAEGVRFVDTAWLSQILGYETQQALGLAGLRLLFAGSLTLCAALLCGRFYRRTGGLGITLVGLAVFTWVEWQQFTLPGTVFLGIVPIPSAGLPRPQLGGLLCFVTLFVLLTARRWHWSNWILVPAVMALWTNLHGSFPVGLLLIGAYAVGRAIDVQRRLHHWRGLLADPMLRRYVVLLELAFVATLFNPYGLGLYAEVAAIAQNPNMTDLMEWEPLTLKMQQGRAAIFTAVVLMFAYRYTPRRISTTEVLLVLGLGAATLWTSRMIVWWAPVVAYYLVLHGRAIWDGKATRAAADPPRSVWTVASAGVALLAFLVSPVALTVTQGKQLDASKVLSDETPRQAAEYLVQNPPAGLVFAPYEWGDYLTWAGPRGLKVYVNSHAHLVPRGIWENYMHIIRMGSGWTEALRVQGINMVILDASRQEGQVDALRDSREEWRVVHDDGRAVIFVRREPI